MSAFMVGDETMTKVLRGVVAVSPKGRVLGSFYLPPLGTYTDFDIALTEAGRRLYGLNWRACVARYGKGKATDSWDDGQDYRYTSKARLDGWRNLDREELCQLYKAVQCLLYQCSEGDIPDTPEFKELQTIAGDLAEAIVEGIPEYKAAKWG